MILCKNNFSFLFLFFLFFVVELVLCGSGQIIHIVGGLTLRMFNFLLVLCATSLYIYKNPLNAEVCKVLAFFLFTTSIGFSLSLITGNTENLFPDIKQLTFFLTLPFVCYMLNDVNKINITSNVIKYSALIMAILYLIYIVLIKYVGVIDFYVFYEMMGEEGDFLFRGDQGELFYKGFLYLVIGLLFCQKEKKYFYSLLILISIYFTMTRGFYVITIISIGLLYVMTHKFTSKTILFMLIFGMSVLLIMNCLGIFEVSDSRKSGDELRILTIKQVFERINPLSFIIGHGFGCGVPIRTVHMENSFLEIFHKQGILGLSFWFYILYKIITFYKYISPLYKDIASIYLVGTIAIYVQSLFNPFLINPIGMSFVLFSFVICYKLSKYNEDFMCNYSLSTEFV